MHSILRYVCRSVLTKIGLWLTDLTFIDDGNPDTTENGLIYYEKASMVAKRIRELEDCLLKPYDFKPQPSVKEVILAAEISTTIRCHMLTDASMGRKRSLPIVKTEGRKNEH